MATPRALRVNAAHRSLVKAGPVSVPHPAAGAAYITGGTGGTWTAGALWLFVLAALILAFRNKAVPTGSQFLTLGAGALGVVIVAAFAPRQVALVLAGVVLLAVANVPGVGGLFTRANAAIAGLVNQQP